MNEDYLWDKSGADAEIEKLENALRQFRYQETAPPVVSTNVLPFKKPAPRQWFQLSSVTAIAACLLFALLAGAAWMKILRSNIERDTVAETRPLQNSTAQPVDEIINSESRIELPVVKSGVVNSPVRVKSFKVRAVLPVQATRQKQLKIKIDKTVPAPAVKLTDEEKYAYDQLMLALSITSSKLKIVKDKVEGTDETNAVLER